VRKKETAFHQCQFVYIHIVHDVPIQIARTAFMPEQFPHLKDVEIFNEIEF
jgi:hypothetical protein